MTKDKEQSAREFTEKYNSIAHQNCITKLNRANERIVEFEDIKKGHLEYVKSLKQQLAEMNKENRKLRTQIADFCIGAEQNEIYVNLHERNQKLKAKCDELLKGISKSLDLMGAPRTMALRELLNKHQEQESE